MKTLLTIIVLLSFSLGICSFVIGCSENDKIIEKINTIRKHESKKPWIKDQGMCILAKKHAEYITKTNQFNHSKYALYEGYGESLGQGNSPQIIVGYLSSEECPLHREHILEKTHNYTKVGVGFSKYRNDKKYVLVILTKSF